MDLQMMDGHSCGVEGVSVGITVQYKYYSITQLLTLDESCNYEDYDYMGE